MAFTSCPIYLRHLQYEKQNINSSKMSVSSSPEPVNMLCRMERGMNFANQLTCREGDYPGYSTWI